MRTVQKKTTSSRGSKLSEKAVKRFLKKTSNKSRGVASVAVRKKFLEALKKYNDSVFNLKMAINALRKDAEHITIRTSELPGVFGDWSKDLYKDVNSSQKWDDFSMGYRFTAVPDWRVEWNKKKDASRSALIDEKIELGRLVSAYKRMVRFPGKYKTVEEARMVNKSINDKRFERRYGK